MYLNETMKWKIVNGSDLFNLTEVPPGYFMDSAMKTFMVTWLALVGTVGLVGNSFAIALTMSESRKLLKEGLTNALNSRRRLVYYFIFNLAISDVFASLIGVPLLALPYFKTNCYVNDLVCKLYRIPQLFFPVVTINLLSILSIERYYLIFRPTALHSRVAIQLVNTAWLLGLILSILSGTTYAVRNLELGNQKFTQVCWYSITTQADKVFFFIFIVSGYVIPTILVFSTTGRVLVALNSIGAVSHDNHETNTGAAEQANQNNSDCITEETNRVQIDKRKTNILLSTVIIVFMFSHIIFVTNSILNMILKGTLSLRTQYILRQISCNISYSTVAINPVLYFSQLKSLRERLTDCLMDLLVVLHITEY